MSPIGGHLGVSHPCQTLLGYFHVLMCVVFLSNTKLGQPDPMPDLGDGNTFGSDSSDEDDHNHGADPRPNNNERQESQDSASDENAGQDSGPDHDGQDLGDNNERQDPRSDEGSQGSGSDHDKQDLGGDAPDILPRGNVSIIDLDLDELACVTTFPKHICDLSFIQALRNASLDDGIELTGDAVHRLRNPPHESLEPDPDTKLALSIFFTLEHSSEESYERIQCSIRDRHSDTLLPSFYHVKQVLADFSGVTSLVNDMCINSCAAFVGPYAHLHQCPKCNEARYDQTRLENNGSDIKAPRAVFNTIPIAPQLQVLWRQPGSAQKMRYREQRTQAIFAELQANDGFVKMYDDVFCGSAYLDADRNQKILPTIMLLMLSIDGAQIYETKESDCWIYIWIILDLSPEH